MNAQPRSSAPRLGQRVRVLSTKYDGSLHNDYEGLLVEDHGAPWGLEGCVRLYVPRGTPLRSYRGEFDTPVDFTALFWPGADRWFNIYHNHWTDDRYTIATYINVSLPAAFDGETLSWVDMDLDVIVRASGAVQLADEDEFAEHLERFGYPDDVVGVVRTAAVELVRAAAAGEPPFDRAAHIWARKPLEA